MTHPPHVQALGSLFFHTFCHVLNFKCEVNSYRGSVSLIPLKGHHPGLKTKSVCLFVTVRFSGILTTFSITHKMKFSSSPNLIIKTKTLQLFYCETAHFRFVKNSQLSYIHRIKPPIHCSARQTSIYKSMTTQTA